ncbi:MAG: hypothetical protein LBD23_01790 [Oscillospiraceae bacterium]|jgi:hypothetical protein|nr:hypothetical protein [Oscillospiraceae bacterium]
MRNLYETPVVVFSQRKITKIFLMMAWSPLCAIPVLLFRDWEATFVSMIMVVTVVVSIIKSKRQIIINDECIVFRYEVLHVEGTAVRTIKILWKDIAKIKHQRRFLARIMIVDYPYNDSVVKDKHISISLFYCNHKTAWKEILSRSLKANPNVEIAEEFRGLFL